MASTGIKAWEKYFAPRPDAEGVNTKTKNAPLYTMDGQLIKGRTLNNADVFVPYEKPRADLLKHIVYQKIDYRTKVDNLLKPVVRKEDSYLSTITADRLVEAGGSNGKILINGEDVEVKFWTSAASMEKTIINSLTSLNMPKHLVTSIKNMIASGYREFEWDPACTKKEKDKMGIYLGELLIGMMALKGGFKFGDAELSRKRFVKFSLPRSANFAGIDSILTTDKGEQVLISSKYDKGAAASFFTNVIPVLFKIKPNMRTGSTTLDILMKIHSRCSDHTGRETLYHYGFNHVMKMKKPYSGKDLIAKLDRYKPKDKEVDPFIKEIVKKLQDPKFKVDGLTPDIRTNAPLSLTYLFSKFVSRQLNADSAAKKAVLEALSIKKFYQANLNTSKWNKGMVEMSVFFSENTGKVEFTSKLSSKDVRGGGGILNYVIKK